MGEHGGARLRSLVGRSRFGSDASARQTRENDPGARIDGRDSDDVSHAERPDGRNGAAHRHGRDQAARGDGAARPVHRRGGSAIPARCGLSAAAAARTGAAVSRAPVGLLLRLAVHRASDAARSRRGPPRCLQARSLAYAVPLAVVLFLFFPRLSGAFWAVPKAGQAVTGSERHHDAEQHRGAHRLGGPRISCLVPAAAFRRHRSGIGAARCCIDSTASPGAAEHEPWLRPRRSSGSVPRTAIACSSNRTEHRWWLRARHPDEIGAVDAPGQRLVLTFDHQLLGAEPITQQLRYQAQSHVRTRALEPLQASSSTWIWRCLRQRIRVPLRWRGSCGRDRPMRRAFVERRARAVSQRGLRVHPDATRARPRPGRRLPVHHARSGFCGHYASAFVTLMRAGGVPARVVTGYLGGEWNPIGSYFLVRQSDAHAWAEIWLGAAGWQRIDPTAVVAPERLQRGLFDLLPGAVLGARALDAPGAVAAHGRSGAGMRPMPGGATASWDSIYGSQLASLRNFGIAAPDWKHLAALLTLGMSAWLAWCAWKFGRMPPTAASRSACARLCASCARKLGPRRDPTRSRIRDPSPMPQACVPGSRSWHTSRAIAAALCAAALRCAERAARGDQGVRARGGSAASACSRVSRNSICGQRSSVSCRLTREGAR